MISDIVSISPKYIVGQSIATVILVKSTCHLFSHMYTFILSVEISAVLVQSDFVHVAVVL